MIVHPNNKRSSASILFILQKYIPAPHAINDKSFRHMADQVCSGVPNFLPLDAMDDDVSEEGFAYLQTLLLGHIHFYFIWTILHIHCYTLVRVFGLPCSIVSSEVMLLHTSQRSQPMIGQTIVGHDVFEHLDLRHGHHRVRPSQMSLLIILQYSPTPGLKGTINFDHRG